MSKDNILLSPKHGLNPSLNCCECCGKEYGIALFGKMKDDQEAPKKVYGGLCDDCQKVVDDGGILIIEVRDGEKGDNPYRTGRMVGCKKNVKKQLNTESSIAYMEESLFSQLFDDIAFQNKES